MLSCRGAPPSCLLPVPTGDPWGVPSQSHRELTASHCQGNALPPRLPPPLAAFGGPGSDSNPGMPAWMAGPCSCPERAGPALAEGAASPLGQKQAMAVGQTRVPRASAGASTKRACSTCLAGAGRIKFAVQRCQLTMEIARTGLWFRLHGVWTGSAPSHGAPTQDSNECLSEMKLVGKYFSKKLTLTVSR